MGRKICFDINNTIVPGYKEEDGSYWIEVTSLLESFGYANSSAMVMTSTVGKELAKREAISKKSEQNRLLILTEAIYLLKQILGKSEKLRKAVDDIQEKLTEKNVEKYILIPDSEAKKKIKTLENQLEAKEMLLIKMKEETWHQKLLDSNWDYLTGNYTHHIERFESFFNVDLQRIADYFNIPKSSKSKLLAIKKLGMISDFIIIMKMPYEEEKLFS